MIRTIDGITSLVTYDLLHFPGLDEESDDGKWPFLGSDRRPIVLDGQLCFLRLMSGELRIENLDNKAVFTHKLSGSEKWLSDEAIIHEDYDTSTKRVVFTRSVADGDVFYGRIEVIVWPYLSHTLSSYDIPVRPAFERRSDGYYPRTPIPLRDDR